MNNEQAVLLSLINCAISGKEFANPKSLDYEELFKEAKRQSVFLMTADAALNNKEFLPKPLAIENKKLAFMALSHNNEVENHQKNLVKILKDNDVPYVIMKGTASASYYFKPQYRSLGDVDFFVLEKDLARVSKILENEGYSKHLEEHENHTVFKKGRISLEMHRNIAGMPSDENGKKVSDFLSDLVYNVSEKKILNTTYKAPSDKNHGLIILLHTAHHLLNEGLGLRHLLDWGFFIESYYKTDEFNEVFVPFLKEIKLLKFAKILTKTAELYFGFTEKEFANDVDKKLCEELINDILHAGNFGNKDKAYRYSGILVTDNKNGVGKSKIKTVLNVLNNTIYSKYPAVKKYKILYPFIFIWRFIRYFFLMLFGKRHNVQKLGNIAEKRKELYKKLKIFEEE